MWPALTSVSGFGPLNRLIVFGVAAVDRVEQLHRLHAVVVVGAHFEEEFFDRAGLRVASRLGEADRRRLIVDDVDRVLRRRLHFLAVRPGQLDPVEALTVDGEVAGERAVRLRRERPVAPVAQQNPSRRRGHRRHHLQEDAGAAEWPRRRRRRPCAARCRCRRGSGTRARVPPRSADRPPPAKTPATGRRSTRRSTRSAFRGGTACLRMRPAARRRRAEPWCNAAPGSLRIITLTSLDVKPTSFAFTA